MPTTSETSSTRTPMTCSPERTSRLQVLGPGGRSGRPSLRRRLITGTIHIQVGGRISDFANWNVNEGPFIPLTEVSVFTVDTGELLFKTEFLAVHRNQINFLTIDKKEPAKPAKP